MWHVCCRASEAVTWKKYWKGGVSQLPPPTFPHSRPHPSLVNLSYLWNLRGGGRLWPRTGWVLSLVQDRSSFQHRKCVRWNSFPTSVRGPQSHRSQGAWSRRSWQLGKTASPVYFQRPVLRQKCSPRLEWRHLGVPGHSQLCLMISTTQEMWLCLGVKETDTYFTENSFDPLSERFNNLSWRTLAACLE